MRTPSVTSLASPAQSTSAGAALLSTLLASAMIFPSACFAQAAAKSPSTQTTQTAQTDASLAPAAATAKPGDKSNDATITEGINPFTGQSLSEEELSRQLNRAKLVTQLGQEKVKQAQNAADLALAMVRSEAETIRMRGEALAQAKQSVQPTKPSTKILIKPAKVSEQAAMQDAPSTPIANAPAPAPWSTSAPSGALSSMGAGPASGTVRIGEETLSVASSYSGPAAQVQWVDSQQRQAARAGSPLQPINVQPATGVIGIPQIPGITPAAMSN